MEFLNNGQIAKLFFKEKQESIIFRSTLKDVLPKENYEIKKTELDDGSIVISVEISNSNEYEWKPFLVTETDAKIPLKENFYEQSHYLPEVAAFFKNLYDVAPKYVIGEAAGVLWLPVHKDDELVECKETEFNHYKSHSYVSSLYDLAFDEEPEECYFINRDAFEAYYGYTYMKDFGYFYCEVCERDICLQNPFNGYQTNYATVDENLICNKCYKEILLTEGVKHIKEHEYIPGTFIEIEELKERGWVKNDTHFVNHSNMSYIKDKINNLLDSGKMATVQLNTVGLGGMEGTMTIWSKDHDS